MPPDGSQSSRLSQQPSVTCTQATFVNLVRILVGAQGNAQFCSTANNVGECMVNLTTSQSPLVLSSNVYFY